MTGIHGSSPKVNSELLVAQSFELTLCPMEMRDTQNQCISTPLWHPSLCNSAREILRWSAEKIHLPDCTSGTRPGPIPQARASEFLRASDETLSAGWEVCRGWRVYTEIKAHVSSDLGSGSFIQGDGAARPGGRSHSLEYRKC